MPHHFFDFGIATPDLGNYSFINEISGIHGGEDGQQETKSRKLQLKPTIYTFSEESNMNNQKSKFDQKWKLIRGQSTEWFDLMAEHDLKKVDKADDKLEKFVTILQVKYGYTRQQARVEINKRWAAFYRANESVAA